MSDGTPPRATNDAEPKSEQQAKSSATQPKAPRTLADVMDAVLKANVRALAFDYAATVVARGFRGSEASPPRLLVRLPGGGPFAANPEHVTEAELELHAMAAAERKRAARLLASQVDADREDVSPTRTRVDVPEPAPPDAMWELNPTSAKPRRGER